MKKRRVRKNSRQAKENLVEHTPKYEFLPEIAKASCGLTLGQFLIGDMGEAKREMDKLLSFKAVTKFNVATLPSNRVSKVLKTVATKVYGMETRSLLDSGAVLNILSKKVADRFGVEPLKTIRRIKGISGVKYLVVGVLKEVPVQLEEKVFRINFLVVNGYPHGLILGIQTMEKLQCVLDFGNHMSSFNFDGEPFDFRRKRSTSTKS